MTRKIGVVENIEFTHGGAGNQWTTISGVTYATWWLAQRIDWKIGDTVEFRQYRAPLWSGQQDTDCADRIKKYVSA